jgi:hypothetical protein
MKFNKRGSDWIIMIINSKIYFLKIFS